MQKLVGIIIALVGVYLLFTGVLFWGLVFLVLGGGIANGAENEVWFCLSFGDDGGDDSGD